jgi:hypothetical protein
MTIIEVVESSRKFTWIHIDCGPNCNKDFILDHLKKEIQGYKEDEYSSVSRWVLWMQDAINELEESISPYQIPEEYKEFLQHYGGLSIDGIDSKFSLLGLGTMTETWYGNINAENQNLWSTGKLNWLNIGELVFHRKHYYYGKRVLFYLDLAGHLQKDCVIAFGPWNGESPEETEFLENIQKFPSLWKKTDNSFSEWLQHAITTQGMFSYK